MTDSEVNNINSDENPKTLIELIAENPEKEQYYRTREAVYDSLLCDDAISTYESPERKLFLSPWLKAGSITIVNAQRGVGKTFFALAITTALNFGLNIGEWQYESPADVLFLDGEMVLHDIQQRFIGLRKGRGEFLSSVIFLSCEELVRNGDSALNLSIPDHRDVVYDLLQEAISKGKSFVLIIDNLSSLISVDENKQESWFPIASWLLSLRRIGIATIILHHLGKNKSAGGRGHSGREDSADSVIELQRPNNYSSDRDGCLFNVSFTKSRGFYNTKPFSFQIKESPNGDIEWFVGEIGSKLRIIAMACLGNGIPQVHLHDLLGCTKGTISKFKIFAIENNYLTENCQFTSKGKSHLGSVDISEYL